MTNWLKQFGYVRIKCTKRCTIFYYFLAIVNLYMLRSGLLLIVS
jgi:hypothetical protein